MKYGYVKVRDDLIPGQIYGGLTMCPGHMSDTVIGQEGVASLFNVGQDDYFEIKDGGYILSPQMIEEYLTDKQLHIQNRITRLKRNPVENAKIIKKWERRLRKAV